MTGKVDEFATVGGFISDGEVNGTRGVVFCPVDATTVAVVSAVVVGAPVGSFACVAVFTDFGTGEKGIEAVGGVDGFAVPEKWFWGVWSFRGSGRSGEGTARIVVLTETLWYFAELAVVCMYGQGIKWKFGFVAKGAHRE